MAREPGSRREKRRLRSRRYNPDGTMTLRDHIYELRHRLGLAVLFILVGAVFGFVWFMVRFGPIPSLSQMLIGPYCDLPSNLRLDMNGKCRLLQTQPFEAFLVQFKVGVAAGMVLTAPLWLYQVWAFITPGLYAKERKFAATFVGLASILFIAGAFLAYFVVPQGLRVLVSFGGDAFITALTADKYISFVLVMLFIFGVSFELPLLVAMLNMAGVLPYANLKRWRRGMIFGVFVFAAFATPGTDPVGMLALSVAMAILLEVAIQIARIHDKRKARREAEEARNDLDPDEPSQLDLTPEPLDSEASPPHPQAKAGLDDVT